MRLRPSWGRLLLVAVMLTALSLSSATPGLANVSPSTFEGNDGNLLINATGHTDWCNQPIGFSATCPTASLAPNFAEGIDLPSGTTDNSFGGGTHEDDPAVTIGTGSIPPNKSDLTRFYAASESILSGTVPQNFLYLAWERSNVLGNANMDFEINQATQPFTETTTGHVTLNRTFGDLLVTYDFGGSGTPMIGLNTWLTSSSQGTCFKASAPPCWGNHQDLTGVATPSAEAGINITTTVTDPITPSAPRSLAANTFGEAAINLTAAGVFPTGTCKAFGSTYLKSRSSSSFTSEVKDFIAPQPVNISNCGTITIIKHTDPRGLDQSFSYTSTVPGAGHDRFTLNDAGNTTSDSITNTINMTNTPAGSYTVVEGAEPTGFTLKSLTCTPAAGSSSGTQDSTNPFQADITLAADGHVTCTYVNQGTGAIQVTKTAKNHNLGAGQHPLAGATFSVNGVSKVTDANGLACFDGLNIGQTYTVTETSPPTGYATDTVTQTVTVSGAATCTSGTPTGVTFTDSPLTDLVVKATSEVSGVTNSTITCKDSSNANVGNSPQGPTDPVTVTATLKPGTYTCTVVIDP